MWKRCTETPEQIEAQCQRNQARLGTRWQERPPTKEEESWRSAYLLWQVYDTYQRLPLFAMMVLTVAGLILLFLLGGCAEYGYKLNELYGFNCRPEALQDGKCVSTKEAKK